MTVSKDLFLSILAMDAYNRGYDAGVSLSDEVDTKIGSATIKKRIQDVEPENFKDIAEANSFYALSYEITGANAPEGLVGKTVISFRGTDNPGADIWTGWTVGAGWAGEPGSMLSGASQAGLAISFFNAATGKNIYDAQYEGAGAEQVATEYAGKDVVTTGHSLGGGLAGFTSMLSGAEGVGIA